MEKLNSLDNIAVSGKVIGKILGVTDRQVRNLAAEGVIPKLPNGSYEIIPALRTYITNIKSAAAKEKTELTDASAYNNEKTMHERAKRIKAELLVGQMKGELHHANDVEKVMGDMLSNLRAKLLAIPTKAAPILIARNDIAIIEDLLKEEIFEALEELSNYSPELFRSDVYVEFIDEGDAVDE